MNLSLDSVLPRGWWQRQRRGLALDRWPSRELPPIGVAQGDMPFVRGLF